MYINYTDRDRFHDHCGIFGIFGHPEAARLTYLGLYALQHRGQESAGICSFDGSEIHCEKGMGYVSEIFSESRIAHLPGSMAIGHVRYSTAGESLIQNAQPLVMDTRQGPLAVCHNGNIANAQALRDQLKRDHATFVSTSDTEIILKLMGRAAGTRLDESMREALLPLQGAYSLLLLGRMKMLAVRDPRGFRPLCVGKFEGAWVFASETCAFDLIGAEYCGEIPPGEIWALGESGLDRLHPFPRESTLHCIFEHVYFARPDSQVFGRSVHQARFELGRQLARESRVPADVVVPVPDSGVTAALGFAAESGILFDFGLIRNHYIGRTFIQPKQAIRQFGVRVKLNPVREIIQGQRVILVDDSIVRGNTSRKIVQMIRSAGAAEIHMRISSPPIISPCFFGIDTPTRKELIAAQMSVDQIRDFLGVESLAYLSNEGLCGAVGDSEKRSYCSSCFTGQYKIMTEEMTRSLHTEELVLNSQSPLF